jgi:predicted LPLAT superfamily acyltransferase
VLRYVFAAAVSSAAKPQPPKGRLLMHWSQHKEEARRYRTLKLTLVLFRVLPGCVLRLIAYPVSFFYYVFSKRARGESRRFLRRAVGGNARISPFRHILAFSLTLIEKMESWGGKASDACLSYRTDDDMRDLKNNLARKKGALLVCSHLGNAELLRGLATRGYSVVERDVPISSIVDVAVTAHFNRMIREVNPDAAINIIPTSEIGPATIIQLQDRIAEGGVVVIAGDRTSANSRNKYFRIPFLGEDASFTYGTFFLAALLDAPAYFFFALREKDVSPRAPRYTVHIHKSPVSFDCPRAERETRIEELARCFAGRLESYCKHYPYQWYNFFDFWAREEDTDESP